MPKEVVARRPPPVKAAFDAAAAAGRPVFVVVNPKAGSVTDREAVVEGVRNAFRVAGIDADVDLCADVPLEVVLRRAVERAHGGEISAIVAGGGDGTVSAAAAAVAGTGIPLGIVPLGTLNHFAKDAGIPLDLAEAVAVIRAGRLREIDIGDMNGITFINNSSIGVYPDMVLDRERLQKRRRLTKWTAMALATWRVLRSLSYRRLRVVAGGSASEVRTPCLLVGNNQYGTQLFNLARRTQLDGGMLWLYVVRPRGVLGLLRLAARVAVGLAVADPDLIVTQGPSIRIDARRRHMLVALDGEVVNARLPLNYAIRPRALTLLAPPVNHG